MSMTYLVRLIPLSHTCVFECIHVCYYTIFTCLPHVHRSKTKNSSRKSNVFPNITVYYASRCGILIRCREKATLYIAKHTLLKRPFGSHRPWNILYSNIKYLPGILVSYTQYKKSQFLFSGGHTMSTLPVSTLNINPVTIVPGFSNLQFFNVSTSSLTLSLASLQVKKSRCDASSPRFCCIMETTS